jgi:hypothetical protein
LFGTSDVATPSSNVPMTTPSGFTSTFGPLPASRSFCARFTSPMFARLASACGVSARRSGLDVI